MESDRFEWGDTKAELNRRNRGVTFEEATTVFDDPNVLIVFDTAHSDEKDRRAAIGFAATAGMLPVTYTTRDLRIRIISARRTTRRERRSYGQGEA